MNISLPNVLKEFVDQQASTAGYGASSEHVRELIRRDQERTQLRNLLLEGAQSKPSGLADADYFVSLRYGIKKRLTKTRRSRLSAMSGQTGMCMNHTPD